MLRTLLILLLFMYTGAVADTLPAYLLDVPASITDVFVADADSATLYRYRRTPAGLRPAGSSYMSIGEKGVGKEREWDRRTPLGIYFVVDQLDTSRMNAKYGPMAFPLDYPNLLDRRNGRSGDGIWVHGVLPGGSRRPAFDTDGCIALPNDDIARLQAAFVPGRTPVIVTRQMRLESDENRERIAAELREAVALWLSALSQPDPSAYFSMYSDDFRYRGLSRDEWEALRRDYLRGGQAKSVTIDDILLLADPEVPGLYLSRFRQRIEPDGFETTKRLYWRRSQDGRLRIVAEGNG